MRRCKVSQTAKKRKRESVTCGAMRRSDHGHRYQGPNNVFESDDDGSFAASISMLASPSPSVCVCTLFRVRASRRPRSSPTPSTPPSLEHSLASDSTLTSSISRSSTFSPHSSTPPFESADEDGFEVVDVFEEDMDKNTEDAADGEADEVDDADDGGATAPLCTVSSLSNTRLRSSKSLPLEACTDTSCWRYRIYSTDC